MNHVLKSCRSAFEAFLDRSKPVEIRRNDRDYRVDDTLTLCEWNGFWFTGRTTTVLVLSVFDLTCAGLAGFVAIKTTTPDGYRENTPEDIEKARRKPGAWGLS